MGATGVAVSYTHLDVYKRQVEDLDIKFELRGKTLNAIRGISMEMCIRDRDGIMAKLHGCILKNTSAKAAVDMAVYDLFAKSCKKPLYRVLGGRRAEIETDLTISVNGIEEMVSDSLKAVGEGFRILKIKVGKEAERDIERIKDIREDAGPDIRLRIDANQGWTAKHAVAIIRNRERCV